jgi:EpsI family protein
MINRRDLLIGGGCLAAAAGAEAMRPRDRMSLLGSAKLEDAIPRRFGGWQEREAEGLITPTSENSLAAKLYTQSVGRFYAGPDDAIVMMLIAYGDTQSDSLQLHRPEVCYPAFGFNLVRNQATALRIADRTAIPARNLTAVAPQRTEQITYWTRIGEYLPVSNSEQREMKLRTAFQGIIPDGVLVRLSNVVGDAAAAFALNERFAADLVQAIRPRHRAALISSDKARQLERAELG